jgi:hypothetical protein
MKTKGPIVPINLPAPSTIPEHVDRISVGKFSAVYVKRFEIIHALDPNAIKLEITSPT